MNDQNQHKEKQRPEETPKNVLGGASAAKSSSGLKKLFAKRWVSPAIFMAAAAIIVTLMWIYQGGDPATPTTAPGDSTEVTQEGVQQEGSEHEGAVAEPVLTDGQEMIWPVEDVEALQVEIGYYDAEASQADREAAVIQVDNTFTPHTGIDFVDPDGATFNVLAALSGEVVRAERHPLLGNIVEINHGNGLVTVYQSLANLDVKQGDQVEQGTIIAQAGRSELERDLGVHLHFETRVNGDTVNPNDYIKP